MRHLSMATVLAVGQVRKWESIRKHFSAADFYHIPKKSLDMRTGQTKVCPDMARQLQQREDREVRTDMSALRLGLTGRQDRVERLRALTSEHHGWRAPERTAGEDNLGILRMIAGDIRALGVGV